MGKHVVQTFAAFPSLAGDGAEGIRAQSRRDAETLSRDPIAPAGVARNRSGFDSAMSGPIDPVRIIPKNNDLVKCADIIVKKTLHRLMRGSLERRPDAALVGCFARLR